MNACEIHPTDLLYVTPSSFYQSVKDFNSPVKVGATTGPKVIDKLKPSTAKLAIAKIFYKYSFIIFFHTLTLLKK